MTHTLTKAVPRNKSVPLYSDWKQAANGGFFTKQQWLENGRRVKKGVAPSAEIDPGEGVFKLYKHTDTRPVSVDLAARYLVIRRFVKYTEMFGYQPFGKNKIVQLPTDSIFGNLRQLLYRSFDYRSRKTGVRFSSRYGHQKYRAERFHIRGTDKMRWFVLDLDNHTPTQESTTAHLQLLKLLLQKLPVLLKDLGGGSVFYDYRIDSPTGIHIWVVLRREYRTVDLHERVRRFLKQAADPRLDKQLTQHGLRSMVEIEVRPTSNQLIAFFGCSGNEVFTTIPLKPKNESLDALSLASHLSETGAKVGDVCDRYARLARLAVGSDTGFFLNAAVLDHQVVLASESAPKIKGSYFRELLDLALRGVQIPDDLYSICLRPLAQCLFFRDCYDQPNKNSHIVECLMLWLLSKHNGNVSRITNGKIRDLRNQVKRVVAKVHKSPGPIQSYWQKVRENDSKYPHRFISIEAAMTTPWDQSVVSSNLPLEELRTTLGSGTTNIKTYCIAGHFASTPTTNKHIPESVIQALDNALAASGTRKNKATERKKTFCIKFLKLIGPTGQRRISQKTLNQLAEYEADAFPKTIRRYKQFLQKAKILKAGSYRGIVRGKTPSLYKLEDWVIEAWRKGV
jgi:hypothetical protein